jgi:hypothetical protein
MGFSSPFSGIVLSLLSCLKTGMIGGYSILFSTSSTFFPYFCSGLR